MFEDWIDERGALPVAEDRPGLCDELGDLTRLRCAVDAREARLLGVIDALDDAGQRGGDTFFSNPALTVPFLGSAGCAIAAGALGIAAVRRHDRSPVVIATTAVGALVLLWSIAELAFPH